MPTANIETVTIGNEVELLPDDFVKGSKINEVNIPESVTSIGSSAFAGCTGLTEVVIPSGVTSISESLFYGCTGLASVALPQDVTTIGNSAFYGCTSLPTVSIPAGVTSIGSYAFLGCTLLDGIVIPEGVTTINGGTFYNCSSLTAINIPAGVTGITTSTASSTSNAFKGCDALKTLVWNARSCTKRGGMPTANIETVTIGNVVTLLPDDFVKGSKITEVNIPSSVESIGKNAFLNCANLTDVTSRALIPPTMAAQNCFSCYNTATLTVSKYAKSDYESTDWWNLFTNTIGVDFDCFEGDSLYYKITSDTEVCVTYRDKDLNSYSGDIRIPSKTIIDGVVYDVTAIGDSAFNLCTDLTSIRMPYSIKSIGKYAFFRCEQLNNVIIPDSVKTIDYHAFSSCNNLKVLDLGQGVISIRDYSFNGCPIQELNIPSSLRRIGNHSFSGCQIKSLFIPQTLLAIGLNPFGGCSSLGEIIVDDGNPNYDSRNGCNAIIRTATNTIITGCKNTVFPDDVTVIGPLAFEYLDLDEIVIPNTITKICDQAYRNNTRITNLEIPCSVTEIGNYAFSYLYQLEKVIIPNSVTSIGISPFKSTYNVLSIEVEKDNPIYDSRNDCNAIIETSTNTLISGCQNTIIPNTVEIIGYSAFSGQSHLLIIDIPNSVKTISQATFTHCYNLKEITIGNGVNWIDKFAFSSCSNLKTITCKAIVPPAIEDSTCFEYVPCDQATLYVPVGSVEAYRADAIWGQFANIVGIDDTVAPGDVNGDGRLSIGDATDLISILLSSSTASAGADVNGDGIINISDITALINMLLSM